MRSNHFLSFFKGKSLAVRPEDRPDAASELGMPTSLVVFCDRRSGNVVALGTNVEKDRGRLPGHFFSEYVVHENVPLGESPQIGQPLVIPAESRTLATSD